MRRWDKSFNIRWLRSNADFDAAIELLELLELQGCGDECDWRQMRDVVEMQERPLEWRRVLNAVYEVFCNRRGGVGQSNEPSIQGDGFDDSGDTK